MKNMDESKLTAFAMDELSGQEKAEIESLLAADPEAAAEVEAVQLLGEQLETAFAQEAGNGLSRQQHEAVIAEVVVSRRKPFWRKPAVLTGLGSMAAMLAIVFWFQQAADREQGVPVAKTPEAARPLLMEQEEPAAPAVAPEMPPSPVYTPEVAVVPVPKTEPLPQPATTPVFALAPPPPVSRSLSISSVSSERAGGLRAMGGSGEGAIRGNLFGAEAYADVWSGGSRGLSARGPQEDFNTEGYDSISENGFRAVGDHPLSTFSVDVDTASYANVRRFLTGGKLPPKGAVRIEELINYFPYQYPEPAEGEPFSVNMEVASCPWAPEHRLLRVGLKTREIPVSERPPSNLVFLIDVSGSMQQSEKLPLLKQSMKLLVEQMREEDRVAIVVYAGAAGVALPSTSGDDKAAITAAIDGLRSGGSTNGAAGIKEAYRQAAAHFIEGGVNRVILATDGDFNVGISSRSGLVDLIREKAKTGVFLTVLGFGTGNLKDSQMEEVADKGNGNYAYIDSLREGRKVLVEQAGGTLVTVAKDVKIQIEFNPAQVAEYRLVGYENRVLAKEDFNNDKKDAGDVGAGHAVTALYEIVPAGRRGGRQGEVDRLKYQTVPEPSAVSSGSEEMLTLKIRFKAPEGDTSRLLEYPLTDSGKGWAASSIDFRWAAAVAQFGMLLRESEYKGTASWDSTEELANEGSSEAGADQYRGEFIDLLRKARRLDQNRQQR